MSLLSYLLLFHYLRTLGLEPGCGQSVFGAHVPIFVSFIVVGVLTITAVLNEGTRFKTSSARI